MFYVKDTLTSSIPSSFSSDDLQQLMKAAAERADEETCECSDNDSTHDFSEEHLTQLASDICDEACERSHGPMIHKVIVLTILTRLIDWHTQNGLQLIQEGEERPGVGWLRDAGKLQAALSQVLEVQLGHDDFTCE